MKTRRFRRALVTGASMGLGRAIARECASRQMSLVLSSLPGEGLGELAESLARDYGVPVRYHEGDLTDPSTLASLQSLASEQEPDLLVNNAGIGRVEPFARSDPGYLDATIALNVSALVRLTRAFLSWPHAGRAPQVLNVASLGAFFPMPSLATYSATKSFVLELSLALREELRGRAGVTVLCPNAIRTTPAVEEYVERFGLLARLACQRPEEVAAAALDGAERNRALVVPGPFNRALLALGRTLPTTLVARAVGRCWGGFGAAAERACDG